MPLLRGGVLEEAALPARGVLGAPSGLSPSPPFPGEMGDAGSTDAKDGCRSTGLPSPCELPGLPAAFKKGGEGPSTPPALSSLLWLLTGESAAAATAPAVSLGGADDCPSSLPWDCACRWRAACCALARARA